MPINLSLVLKPERHIVKRLPSFPFNNDTLEFTPSDTTPFISNALNHIKVFHISPQIYVIDSLLAC